MTCASAHLQAVVTSIRQAAGESVLACPRTLAGVLPYITCVSSLSFCRSSQTQVLSFFLVVFFWVLSWFYYLKTLSW